MTLFLVLSTLYITLTFCIFKKQAKNLLISILILILSFIDDSFLISQEKSTAKSNTNLFCSYNIIFLLFNNFCLKIKYNKLEIFYFSRATRNFNPLLLDFSLLKSEGISLVFYCFSSISHFFCDTSFVL